MECRQSQLNFLADTHSRERAGLTEHCGETGTRKNVCLFGTVLLRINVKILYYC